MRSWSSPELSRYLTASASQPLHISVLCSRSCCFPFCRLHVGMAQFDCCVTQIPPALLWTGVAEKPLHLANITGACVQRPRRRAAQVVQSPGPFYLCQPLRSRQCAREAVVVRRFTLVIVLGDQWFQRVGCSSASEEQPLLQPFCHRYCVAAIRLAAPCDCPRLKVAVACRESHYRRVSDSRLSGQQQCQLQLWSSDSIHCLELHIRHRYFTWPDWL